MQMWLLPENSPSLVPTEQQQKFSTFGCKKKFQWQYSITGSPLIRRENITAATTTTTINRAISMSARQKAICNYFLCQVIVEADLALLLIYP